MAAGPPGIPVFCEAVGGKIAVAFDKSSILWDVVGDDMMSELDGSTILSGPAGVAITVGLDSTG